MEVCLDERDRVWVVLHSGSRGIGNELAKVHIEGAKAFMAQYFIQLDDPDLAYFVEGTPEFDAYIRAMLWAQDYALANRETMMDAVAGAAAPRSSASDVDEVARINCHHNYREQEHHHGRDLWVTRKGAIRARTGRHGHHPRLHGHWHLHRRGPGQSGRYDSCSHGAGRRMSRSQAQDACSTWTSFRAAMAGKAWQADQAQGLLDEDPAAYKDIDEVMADQADLVRSLHTLTPGPQLQGPLRSASRRRSSGRRRSAEAGLATLARP